MRRIAFINEKGGTCKTTLAVSTAAYLARERRRTVLLVDLDTQGHAGKSLGVDVRSLPRTVFDLLVDPSVRFAEVVQATPVSGLYLLPSNKAIAEFPVRVADDPERALCLARRLLPIRGFDAILFDAPPSMGLSTTNVMLAAEEIVVPVALTYFALDGCAEILDTVRRVAQAHGRSDLHVTRVVPTLYRRTALADAILEKLRAYFPRELSRTVLGYNVDVDEAQSHGKTIFEYAPRSRGARMLRAIAEEIVAAEDAGVDASPQRPDVTAC